MTREARGPWRRDPGLEVLLGMAGVTALLQLAGPTRALLDLYYLPAVWAACTLGARRGAGIALVACGIGFATAAMNHARFTAAGPGGGMPWLDLGTWGVTLVLASLLAGVLHDVRERRARALEETCRGTLDLMSRLIDSVERYSENHSRRVAESSVEVALALGLSETEVEDIRVGAFLHDIGRMDIRADVLARAAGLTPEELEEMESDGQRGGRPVRAMGGTLRRVLPIVTCHQERWDGTGQKALQGGEIPLGARVIAVADAYDAMVTDRAYQKGRTREEALAMVQGASGTQFDPRVVEVFLQLQGAQPVSSAAAGIAA